jgi:hypothetical protein
MNKQTLMNLIRTAALAAMAAIPGMCCSYSVSVPAIGAGGGPVPVYVTTQPGCSWEISHASAFLSYYGGRTGTGSGVAYLYATADRGAARSAPVYALQPYSYSCGLGGRSIQLCTGYTTAAGTTAVQY